VNGAGWAGCATVVEATRLGHSVTLFKASRISGRRALRVDGLLRGQSLPLDNDQHILIGAYSETLRLMAALSIDQQSLLLCLPLTLQFSDGSGMKLPASHWLPAARCVCRHLARAAGRGQTVCRYSRSRCAGSCKAFVALVTGRWPTFAAG
jgi:predicted NAD/FAD-binding protein